MADAKISIIMGVYNCSSTIGAAIESIIQQTYTNWELIIGDDGSDDDTYQIVEEYRRLHPEKILLFRNDRNMKLAATLNKCLHYATGYYIARMDGDDISLPERLSEQVSFLQNNPQIDLVGTAFWGLYNESKTICRVDRSPDYLSLLNGNPFAHPTIMTYKRIYDLLGGYTVAPRTSRCEDVDLWFRFFCAGFHGANIIEPLYVYRIPMHREKIKDNWGKWRTRVIGYKKLHYPVRAYILFSLKTVARMICPEVAYQIYRKRHYINKNQ